MVEIGPPLLPGRLESELAHQQPDCAVALRHLTSAATAVNAIETAGDSEFEMRIQCRATYRISKSGGTGNKTYPDLETHPEEGYIYINQ